MVKYNAPELGIGACAVTIYIAYAICVQSRQGDAPHAANSSIVFHAPRKKTLFLITRNDILVFICNAIDYSEPSGRIYAAAKAAELAKP